MFYKNFDFKLAQQNDMTEFVRTCFWTICWKESLSTKMDKNFFDWNI